MATSFEEIMGYAAPSSVSFEEAMGYAAPSSTNTATKPLSFEEEMGHASKERIKSFEEEMGVYPATKESTLNQLYDEAAKKYKVDSSILKAIAWQESGFNPTIGRKDTGVKGLSQFTPETWARTRKAMGLPLSNRENVADHIETQAFHFAQLMKQAKGNVDEAIALWKGPQGLKGYDYYVKEPSTEYVKKVRKWQNKITKGEIPEGLSRKVVFDTGREQAKQELQDTAVEPIETAVTTEKSQNIVNRMKDVTLKVLDAFSVPSSALWAGLASASGKGKFGELFDKYQREGAPVAIAARDAVKDSLESSGVENKYVKTVATFLAGFAGDIVSDPLTYTGIGLLTKTGKLAKAGGTLAKTAAEQAAKGERSLLQATIPFTDKGITLVKGAPVIAGAERAGEAIRPLFGLFQAGSKIKDPGTRKAMNDLLWGSKDRGAYFAQILERKAAESMRVIDSVDPKEVMKIKGIADDKRLAELLNTKGVGGLSTIISEDPKLIARAEAGDFEWFGRKALESRRYNDLAKGIREGDKDALDAVGAGNLAGKWEHDVKSIESEDLKYVPHAIPSETNQALKQTDRFGAAPISENVSDEVARTLVDATGMPTYTIDQINNFAKMTPDEMITQGVPKDTAHKIARIRQAITDYQNEKNIFGFIRKNRKAADEIFSTNPGYLMKLTTQRTGKAISGASFRREVGLQFGKTGDEFISNPNYVKIDKFQGTPEGKMYFRKDIADDINRIQGSYFNDAELEPFVKAFDTAQNWWKAWTLSVFPSYHSRNWASGAWNNFVLAGMNNPLQYVKAGKIQAADMMAKGEITPRQWFELKQIKNVFDRKTAEIGMREANKIKGKEMLSRYKLANGMGAEEALNLARQHGIRGSSTYEAELITPQSTGKKQSLLSKTLGTESKPIELGKRFGSAVEDNLRLSLFFDRLEKGYIPKAAADDVVKYQYDYTRMSPAEKKVMVRVAPFYRFTRLNTPTQIAAIIEKPFIMSAVKHGRTQANQNQDMPQWKDALLQDYMAQNIAVQLGTKKVNGKELPALFTLGNWFPTTTMLQQTSHPVLTAMTMLTPFVRVPAELGTGYDFVRRRNIVEYERGRIKEPIINVPVDARIKHVFKSVRALNTIDAIIGSAITQVSPEMSNYIVRSGYKPDLLDQTNKYLLGLMRNPFDAEEAKIYRMGKMASEAKKLAFAYRLAASRKDDANMDAVLQRYMLIRDRVAELNGLTNKSEQIDLNQIKEVSQ